MINTRLHFVFQTDFIFNHHIKLKSYATGNRLSQNLAFKFTIKKMPSETASSFDWHLCAKFFHQFLGFMQNIAFSLFNQPLQCFSSCFRITDFDIHLSQIIFGFKWCSHTD